MTKVRLVAFPVHRWSAERTADPSASLGACDFLVSLVVCGRKAPKSICQQASPGSFDCAPQTLCYAIDMRGASLRMTILWRGPKNIWSGTKTRKDRKSHRLSE